jgi:hypothetical protein
MDASLGSLLIQAVTGIESASHLPIKGPSEGDRERWELELWELEPWGLG